MLDLLKKIKWYIRKILLKYRIVKYYNTHPREVNSEVQKVLEFLKSNRLQIFNYEFTKNYTKDNTINFDNKYKLHYIIEKNKRMYFKRDMTIQEINNYYNSICLEQDNKSPHLYLDEELKNRNFGIVVDAGVAEGNFALSIIDQVKELYLFEVDELWIEALRATFEPYKDKVHIINKYVSNKNDEKQISLDKYFHNKTVDLIKMDIEGAEVLALNGLSNVMKGNPNITLLICAYHRADDEEKIRQVLSNCNIKQRDGYMVFLYDSELDKPYLRRGVLKVDGIKG